MNRRLFVLLVVLMSLSLIGIIFVQGYWINNTVKNNEEQFSFNAKQILMSVAEKTQYKEFERFYFPFRALIDSLKNPDISSIEQLLLIDQNKAIGETFVYANDILEEDFKLSEAFRRSYQDNSNASDSLRGGNKTGLNSTENNLTAASRLERIAGLGNYEQQLFQNTIQHYANRIPIHKRVNKTELERLLDQELRDRSMKITYEYAIYSNALATRIRSEDFTLEGPTTYSTPIFVDENDVSRYQLFVNFTGKKRFILANITLMAALSIIFTLIIVVAYSSALSQLLQQRQISQIKTDFINNMTHELKTPIATINLALDSIKNPKISGDPEKVNRYMVMIREENKRMHAQVENVLRISQLEKNELNIQKESLQLHEIIEEAITHVSLMVEDRKGYIKAHLGALKSSILANDSHFTNVIVNILDNAIKYSENEPKIDIYTENIKDSIIVKVRDQGVGMSKASQNKIFDKFFREHTGDLHNVKGHGLGLTYVKRIVDDHHGEIWVESEKGIGTTFILKLPLIS